MEIRSQIIELVQKFLVVADNLLMDGKIDRQTYELMTENKIKFLELSGISFEHCREQDNG